jgi:hypothetical protein
VTHTGAARHEKSTKKTIGIHKKAGVLHKRTPRTYCTHMGYPHTSPHCAVNIKRRLDHAWIDQTAVSAKAAKNDASGIPTHLWDQRILLPLPGVQGGLAFLRSRFMRFQHARLYTEFGNCMQKHSRKEGLMLLLRICEHIIH